MVRNDIPAVPDKFKAPELGADHLPPPRLTQRLGGAGGTPVTLVCAPSGFGKTGLVSHGARDADEPVAWLRLDAEDGDVGDGDVEDGDVEAIARNLVSSVRTVSPDVGDRTHGLLKKRSPVETEEYGRSLLADLNGVTTPFVLVLDDYGSLPPGDVHDVVDEILRHRPTSMRLILIARHDPPLALQELLVAGRASEIRQAALMGILHTLNHYQLPLLSAEFQSPAGDAGTPPDAWHPVRVPEAWDR